MQHLRIGASWSITPRNVDSNFYVAEVRRHWYENPLWDYVGAARKCLVDGQYLIFNQCLGYNKTMPHPEHYPTEEEWRQRTEENIRLLQGLGANKNNCMMTLINEPTKYFRVENGYNGVNDLIRFTNIMHDQIDGRFDLGSGNMEFYDAMVLGDWIRFLCMNGNFEYLLIHIQNSCDTEEHTREYTDYAKGLADMYGKKLSCSEAMHTGWNMAGGDYSKLLMQLQHAERIGCQDFCVICLDLDTEAAKQELDLTGNWQNMCFKINGVDRSNGNYDDLKRIADEKAPVPNIPKRKDTSMLLEEFYYWRKVTFKRDPDKYGVKFIQLAMNNYMDQTLDGEDFTLGQAFENYNKKYTDPNSSDYDQTRSVLTWNGTDWFIRVDGDFGQKTCAVVEEFQRFKNIDDDGIVGPITFDNLMDENFKTFTKVQLDWARNS